jgi:hypothetical protein
MKTILVCEICKKEFYPKNRCLKQKTCGQKCGYELRKLGISGEKHPMKRLEMRKMMSEKFRGELGPGWKGGRRIDKAGYVYVYNPDHLNTTMNRCVYEHRLVMEKQISRYLEPEEVVHHINGIKDDNRIENLMLFANDLEHRKYHKLNNLERVYA